MEDKYDMIQGKSHRSNQNSMNLIALCICFISTMFRSPFSHVMSADALRVVIAAGYSYKNASQTSFERKNETERGREKETKTQKQRERERSLRKKQDS